jgi:hypothetical protein
MFPIKIGVGNQISFQLLFRSKSDLPNHTSIFSNHCIILLVAKGFCTAGKANAERDLQLQFLGFAATFDELLSDSRFQNLLRRVGLSQ